MSAASPERPASSNRLNDLLQGPRRRAVQAAQTVLTGAGLGGWAGEAGDRLAQLVDEVGQARRANRELLDEFVAAEVGRAAARIGLVPRQQLRQALDRVSVLDQEVAALGSELAELRLRVATLEAAVGQAAGADRRQGEQR